MSYCTKVVSFSYVRTFVFNSYSMHFNNQFVPFSGARPHIFRPWVPFSTTDDPRYSIFVSNYQSLLHGCSGGKDIEGMVCKFFKTLILVHCTQNVVASDYWDDLVGPDASTQGLAPYFGLFYDHLYLELT